MKRFNQLLIAAVLVYGTAWGWDGDGFGKSGLIPTQTRIVDGNGGSVQAGWLILRGELLGGPHQIEVGADTVYVNGRPLKRPAAVSPATAPDALAAERQELFETFEAAWKEWCAREDEPEAAQQAAVAFWNAAPAVADAEAVPESCTDLRVWFWAEEQPRYLHLHPWVEETALAPDAARREWLTELAADLTIRLAQGDLLIMQDEGYRFAPAAGQGADILRQIREIAATISEEAARFEALRRIIPDDEMARAIAQRFQPD